MSTAKKSISVFPKSEYHARKNLFTSFESIYPVTFTGIETPAPAEFHACIYFVQHGVPSNLGIIPALLIQTSKRKQEPEHTCFIRFTQSKLLAPLLRDKKLNDYDYTYTEPLKQITGDDVLASVSHEPVWIKRKINSSFIDIISTPMNELEKGMSLRNYTYKFGCFPIIALVHFLREVTNDIVYESPKLRASFIIDDINIKTRKYGAIIFKELVDLAKHQHFHVVFASIPLDLFRTEISVIRLLQNNPEYISLAPHGNNHTKDEMKKNYSNAKELKLVSGILARISAFENRTGLKMSSVMIPPHGNITPQMLKALSLFNFDAVCASSQFPFLAHLTDDKIIPEQPELTEWFPADCISGMNIIPRRFPPLSKGEILLAAFLHHPIIVRYHPRQLAHGYDNLLRKAKYINSLGDVNWSSLGEIAETNFLHRTDDNTLRIKPFSNRIRVNVPEGINRAIFEIPVIHGIPEPKKIFINGKPYQLSNSNPGYESEPIMPEQPGNQTFSIGFFDPVDISKIRPFAFSLWAYIRRFITETGDRTYHRFH